MTAPPQDFQFTRVERGILRPKSLSLYEELFVSVCDFDPEIYTHWCHITTPLSIYTNTLV